MRKPGDIETIYGNPAKRTGRAKSARLVQFLGCDERNLELWIVEFIDQEGCFKEALLKKE